MRDPYFDSSWYRVADLKPRLRSHTQFHRQRFRGQTWFVVQDHQTGKFHRLSPVANLLVAQLDGERTIQQIWDSIGEELGDSRPSQTEVIRLLSQLHQADLLIGDVSPDFAEMARRAEKKRKQDFWQKFKNPLAIRLPLLDPYRLLEKLLPFFRWCFGPLGLLLWLSVVITGATLAFLNWPELTNNVFDRVLTAGNILPIVVTYCVVKAIHELGHGLAAARWGGEIHEMGVMLLIFMPVPYVDASTSSSFRSKWQRATVGAAGIMVELFLAGLAMVVWALVEQGTVRAYAFNVMAIAGISTLLFNGNPLLKFDGYHVLCDLVEIPNLGNRANQYLQYLFKKYLLGIPEQRSPANSAGERRWFVAYAISAWIYRILLMATIAYFLMTSYPVVGLVLAAWIVFSTFVKPLWKGARFLVTHPGLHRRRRGAIAAVSGGAVALLLLVFGTPLPYGTVVEGVLWVPDNAAVRAQTEGTVADVLAVPNSAVAAGDALFTLDDPALDAQIAVIEAEREELVLRHGAVRMVDRVQALMLTEQIQRTDASLDLLRERARNRTVSAERSGRFVVPAVADLPGRFVQRGTQLGFVIDTNDAIVYALVGQDDIDLVRQRTASIDVRFVQKPEETHGALVSRETPAAVDILPSPALGVAGGGKIALDPSDPESQRLLTDMFQVELALQGAAPVAEIGGRVYVRFDHGFYPLGPRILRRLRQLFLSIANV